MIRGTIFDIKKFAVHDGPGIRTTVFFKGCPLECRWCHNPESRNRQIEKICVRLRRGDGSEIVRDRVYGRDVSTEDVFREILKDRVFYEESGGGATFSGGEPLLQIDFLLELLQQCKAAGIHTAVDTSGYVDFERLERIVDVTDMFLYDLKLADTADHERYIGVPNASIIENLQRLARHHDDIVIRVPLIPGMTDTGDNIEGIAAIVASIKNIQKVSLLPYNSLVEDKIERFGWDNNLGHLQTQDTTALQAIKEIFTARGYTVTVGG